MTLRICILQVDEVREEIRPPHDDYPQMFMRLFNQLRQDIDWQVVDAREQLPASIDCDAYLITGSRDSVYDDLPWMPALVEFLRQVLNQGRKIIGICFGHQLMAHFFGGKVGPAAQGWGVGARAQNIVELKPWMTPAAEQFVLLCSHKDQVLEPPADSVVYAASEFCPIAGFTMGEQVITVQGHPEFYKAYSSDLLNLRRDLLGEAVYTAGMQSLDVPTDELLFAQWVLNFLNAEHK